MIQATELRLNNYVKYNGIIMSVTAIDSPKPRKENRFDGKYLIELFDGTGFITATTDQIDGVELTEDFLLGSGFVRQRTTPHIMELPLPDLGHEGSAEYYDFQKCLTLRMSGYYYDDKISFYDKIKHLHQLQNIIQSTSQKELQINLHNQKKSIKLQR